MTEGPILRKIIFFALPIMGANLLQQMYNAVDNIIVGNYAEKAHPGSLTAIGFTASPTFLFLAFAIGLSVGVSVLCSQLYGARLKEKLIVAIDTSIILLAGVGVAIMIIGWFITPWLLGTVLGIESDTDVYSLALTYLRIYCIGLPFQFVYNSIAACLRGVGDSFSILIFLLISSFINVGLDMWFVISFDWGVMGAAVATVISQVICVCVSYYYLRRKFPLVKGGRHFDKGLCKTVVKIGLPTALQQCVVSAGNVAMMRLVNYFSPQIPGTTLKETAVSDAFTAANRIDMFAFVPVMGFQNALASFSGQNLAANKQDRVKKGLYNTVGLGLGVMVVILVLMYVLASPLVSLFGLEGRALEIGIEQVRYYAKVYWIFAAYMIFAGVLQGAGDTILQSAATLSALTIRVVLAYVGVFVFSWFGYEATWSTLAYGWVVAFLITVIRYYTGGWKKKVVVHRKPQQEPLTETAGNDS